MNKEIQIQEWYESLVEECKAIITEAVFTSRWALVEGYWNLGKRISEENGNFQREKIYGGKIVQDLAISLSISPRTVHYALQAYKKFPEIGKIPEGKNITWNKLITQYLPEPKTVAPLQLPEGKYSVIYADPPWQYSNSGISGAAENHYPTMSTDDICKMQIPATDNSVLFLWVTNPLLEDALCVVKAWGFEYKTNIVWVKQKAGQGFYVKGQHELLFICVKGSFTPDNKIYIRSVVELPKSDKHSQKPEKFYEIIEELYPKEKYLELFARNKRKGWESWGNQV